MEGIDATDRIETTSNAPPPSILTIILDTNPVAWDNLSSTLTLSKAIANILVFINAHLAINHANQVCVIASHTDRATYLYPTPHYSLDKSQSANGLNSPTATEEEAKKYRPFLAVEREVLANLRSLMEDTNPSDLLNDSSTQIAGALTTALTYTNKQTILASPSGADANYIRVDQPGITSTFGGNHTTAQNANLVSRLLVISVSSDLSSQYIAIMNAIFASQRLQIPIDVLKLAGDSIFLQQASDATGGIYMDPALASLKGNGAGLLQYLMMAYLPDVTCRKWLVMPGKDEVDFSAACFCHRNVVDVGFVCSVCLSIFCTPTILPNQTCLTCSTPLNLPQNFNVKPAVLPKKKKKPKKKKIGEGGSGVDTPAGNTTPAR